MNRSSDIASAYVVRRPAQDERNIPVVKNSLRRHHRRRAPAQQAAEDALQQLDVVREQIEEIGPRDRSALPSVTTSARFANGKPPRVSATPTMSPASAISAPRRHVRHGHCRRGPRESTARGRRAGRRPTFSVTGRATWASATSCAEVARASSGLVCSSRTRSTGLRPAATRRSIPVSAGHAARSAT